MGRQHAVLLGMSRVAGRRGQNWDPRQPWWLLQRRGEHPGGQLALPFPPGCTRAGPGARVPWGLLVVPWEKLKRPGSPDRERDGDLVTGAC